MFFQLIHEWHSRCWLLQGLSSESSKVRSHLDHLDVLRLTLSERVFLHFTLSWSIAIRKVNWPLPKPYSDQGWLLATRKSNPEYAVLFLLFSYAAAFLLWPIWEEQTQVYGSDNVCTRWRHWHSRKLGMYCSYREHDNSIKRLVLNHSTEVARWPRRGTVTILVLKFWYWSSV